MPFQVIEQVISFILRNTPTKAHALYLQGYMEKLGRGSVLITQACREAGLPDPV
ncbi:hypothetical protein [Thiomicrospira sp. ALE5]|uniref:hypothetical protein n=1 Tax=Thiomicrospira sp. ALE5 TaxID=748650 RepID=UPI00190F064D|nr:hypothetical protein [Thiomicrospira sp. ALE5]